METRDPSMQPMPGQRAFSRRDFLRLSGLASLVGASALITACGGETTTPTTGAQATATVASAGSPTNTAMTSGATTPTKGASTSTSGAAMPAASSPTSAAAAAPGKYKEASALADMVKSGKLPPIEQRLPKNPLVVKPVEKVGKYGGTWRTALVGGSDTAWLIRTIGYENLLRWDPEWKDVVPNVAESVTPSVDAKEFTVKLREGMKWSDGQPYNADDIVFYIEDIDKNKELTTSRGTNPPEVQKIDDYTFKLTYQKPNGLFLPNTANVGGDAWTRYPAHYLKQFHKKYADPAKLDQLIKDNKAEDWVKLFRLKGQGIPGTPYDARWQNPALPTLFGWKIVDPYGEGTRVTAERNPFYFKVDSEGNQLPYIDKVNYDVLQDPQVLLLKASNGEIDMHERHINTDQNKAVLADNRQKGNYHFFDEVPSSMNTNIIALNLTHKDPALRQIFQNKDFRIGLSYAINRQEIIDTVYVSQGEPWQSSPRKTTPYYNEKLAKQFTEFDITKANAALDKVLPKKDGQGFRLRSDGQRLTFTMEVTASGVTATTVDAMKLVQGYWQKVGIDVQLKPEDRSLFYTRKNANEHDCVVWGGDGGGSDALTETRWFFPSSNESNYAEAWFTWYAQPSNPLTPAEEPPAATKKQMELYRNDLQGTGDRNKQRDIFNQILDIAAEEFYVIGISLPGDGYGIVKNTFHNVPQSLPGAWLYPSPAPTNPCQYWMEK